jgi:hypothetical protein
VRESCEEWAVPARRTDAGGRRPPLQLLHSAQAQPSRQALGVPGGRGVTKPKTLFAVVCFALWALVASAADWPNFRGPAGQGISQEKDLPTTWGDTANLAWKTKLPSAGASSEITVGDRVFVTCYSGYGIGKSIFNASPAVSNGQLLLQSDRYVYCVGKK